MVFLFQEHVLRMAGLPGGHGPGHPDQNRRLWKLQSSDCRSGQDGAAAERPAAEEGTQRKTNIDASGHDHS